MLSSKEFHFQSQLQFQIYVQGITKYAIQFNDIPTKSIKKPKHIEYNQN